MKISPITFLVVAFTITPLAWADKQFNIQVDTPTIGVGDYVLCPSRQFYDAAVQNGVDKPTFIYYAARMSKIGDAESEVTSLSGRTFELPNEFIISIPRGQTADIGDVVLTWWQSGSGMQRAIVVGGTSTQPIVRYLDIQYENPSGAGKNEDTLRPDSFCVLSKPFQIGSTVAVNAGGQRRFGHVLASGHGKFLVQEFAGKLKLYDRSLAVALPIRPQVSSGEVVDAALFGTLKPVTVVQVDPRIGRIFANYRWGKTEKHQAFAFGQVLPR